MQKFRVFISHSAHPAEEPETADFLERLVNRLEASRYDVLVDVRSLMAGDEWMHKIYSWLGLCHAAVILLSPRSVQRENSIWVPRECNILMWRKALDPGFTVCPVFLRGITQQQVSDNPLFKDLKLNELQIPLNIDDDNKIDRIVEALAARFGDAEKLTAFEALETYVSDALSRYGPQHSISNALKALTADCKWSPYTDDAANLATHLIRTGFSETALRAVRLAAQSSQPEYRLGSKLFDALFPLGVNTSAAGNLGRQALLRAGQLVVAINCRDAWLIKFYIRSASGLPPDECEKRWVMVELPDGWGDDDQNEIRAFLLNELSNRLLGSAMLALFPSEELPNLVKQRMIDRFEDQRLPVVICARYSKRLVELSAKIHEDFPLSTIVLWTGEDIPAEIEDSDHECNILEPRLAPGEDSSYRLRYSRIQDYV
ncbi:toll/interleukin-1 receptor domain-containing protein [Methylomonas sp. MgM2]